MSKMKLVSVVNNWYLAKTLASSYLSAINREIYWRLFPTALKNNQPQVCHGISPKMTKACLPRAIAIMASVVKSKVQFR